LGKKTKHRGGATPARPWTPFAEAVPYRDGKPAPEALVENETLWLNSHYVVHRHLLEGKMEGAIHLSIRDHKRRAVRDWRHFQRIKNELAGRDREAIEIFPPEDNLIDTANQYHLFVLPIGVSTPFTWKEGRHVDSTGQSEETKQWVASKGFDPEHIKSAVQRPYEEDQLVSN
jgi:hypothetical protein